MRFYIEMIRKSNNETETILDDVTTKRIFDVTLFDVNELGEFVSCLIDQNYYIRNIESENMNNVVIEIRYIGSCAGFMTSKCMADTILASIIHHNKGYNINTISCSTSMDDMSIIYLDKEVARLVSRKIDTDEESV